MDIEEDRPAWLARHQICTLNADSFSGHIVGNPCPECGHTNVAHIGVDACVICELRAELADLRVSRQSG